jgi:lysyl-tRNA synthetase class I
MKITFEDDKKCNCYRDLVNSEGGRQEIKRFSKHFDNQLISAVLRLHQRLKSAENAECYNSIAGMDNRINKVAGQKKNDPLILKVRIQSAYRKFFHYMTACDGCLKECIEDGWTGQFNLVKNIHVFKINKHDYDEL